MLGHVTHLLADPGMEVMDPTKMSPESVSWVGGSAWDKCCDEGTKKRSSAAAFLADTQFSSSIRLGGSKLEGIRGGRATVAAAVARVLSSPFERA